MGDSDVMMLNPPIFIARISLFLFIIHISEIIDIIDETGIILRVIYGRLNRKNNKISCMETEALIKLSILKTISITKNNVQRMKWHNMKSLMNSLEMYFDNVVIFHDSGIYPRHYLSAGLYFFLYKVRIYLKRNIKK